MGRLVISVRCLKVQVRMLSLEFQQTHDFQKQQVFDVFCSIYHTIRFIKLFVKEGLSNVF